MRIWFTRVAFAAAVVGVLGCDRVWTYSQDAYPPEKRGRCVQAWSSEKYDDGMMTCCTKANLAGAHYCHFHTRLGDNIE